jgi:hypothetical protein
MSEFDPDKWWTWPIPGAGIQGTKSNGNPILNEYGEGWVTGFEAGRISLADEIWERSRVRHDA